MKKMCNTLTLPLVRVRVGNTDAEGRMAMADPLYHTKQQALNEIDPHIVTLATLTGHAVVSVGRAYTIGIDISFFP